MKKIISFVLVLVLTLSVFCGCSSYENKTGTQNEATEATTEPQNLPTHSKATSDEAVVKVFMDNIDVWKSTVESTEWYGYLFLDLDFDGVLELVSTVCRGTGFFSENRYYKADMQTKTVSEIPFPGRDSSMECDLTGIDYPQLYRNNATGKLKYLMYDNMRNGAANTTTTLSELWLDENGNIATQNLWTFDYAAESYNVQGVYTYITYDESGKAITITEAEYDELLEQYEIANTNLKMEFKTVSGYGTIESDYSDFHSLDYNKQTELLLESYNAFKY